MLHINRHFTLKQALVFFWIPPLTPSKDPIWRFTAQVILCTDETHTHERTKRKFYYQKHGSDRPACAGVRTTPELHSSHR